MAKFSKLPLLLSAARFLLFSLCVVQAQVVEISVPHFKRQHEDGSLDITVNCSLTDTGKHFLRYGPCTILSYARGRLPDDRVELASYGGWEPQNSLKECVHTLKLKHEQQMAAGATNQVGSGDGVRSDEQLLYCQRGILSQKCMKDWIGRTRCTPSEPTWASSPHQRESTSELVRKYKRSARIISRRIGASEINDDALNVPYNKRVTMECEVQNLSNLPENRCRWQFVNNQNSSFFYGGKDTVVPAAGSNQKAVVRKHSERRNGCLLELTDVDETMEGHWSCNPSEGQDGFISPLNPVLIKVVDNLADGCDKHSQCPDNQVCLNTTVNGPRRICGNPCDLENGKQTCGNLANSYCKVDKNASGGTAYCACLNGYGTDTGHFNNRTRCLPVCSNHENCAAAEGLCIPVGPKNTGRCFPVCEVTKPPCGPGASCEKSSPSHPDAPWTSKCKCDAGKFKNDSLSNTSFECELPIFEGLHMNIKIDGREQHKTCSIFHANGSEKCQTTVTDGSLLQVTCEAPRVFPADATLELGLTKYLGEDLPAVEADDDDSLLHGPPGPPPGQPLLNSTIENLPDQLGAWYRGQFPATNVTIADHDNATFLCKLTTLGSSNVTLIEMKLNVTRLPDVAAVTDNLLGSSVSMVAGSAVASVVAVIVLGAIVVMAKKRRQQHREQQTGSRVHVAMTCNSVSYSRRVNSDLVEDDEFDGGVYEEIIPSHLRPTTDFHGSAWATSAADQHAHQRLVYPSPIPPANHIDGTEQENIYF